MVRMASNVAQLRPSSDSIVICVMHPFASLLRGELVRARSIALLRRSDHALNPIARFYCLLNHKTSLDSQLAQIPLLGGDLSIVAQHTCTAADCNDLAECPKRAVIAKYCRGCDLSM
jgi:hypothetical protein